MADDFISGALAGQQFQLNKFLLAEAPVELEQKKLALKVAETDYEKRQQMAKLLAGSPTQIPDDRNPLTQASQNLAKMGAAAAQAGLPEEAVDYFSKASTIANQQETAAYHRWQETKQRSDFADKMLAQVHDEASWKQMNDYIELSTGKPSAMKDKPYSPELVQALKDASAAHRTEAQEALTREQTKRTKLEEQLDVERIPLLKKQEELTEARIANVKKVGSGALPNSKTVAAMSDFIVKEYGDANVSATDARVFARNLAPEVEEAMDKQHLTQGQAVAQVFQKAKERGDLAGVAPSHVRPGQSMKKPMPLPAAKNDPKAYKDQMWYQAPPGGWQDTGTDEPRWFDQESGKVYPAGEGPETDEE